MIPVNDLSFSFIRNRTLKRLYFIVLVTLLFLDIIVVFFLPQVRFGYHVAYSVYVQGDYAYVSDNEGVDIINIANPVNPTRIDEIRSPDGAFRFSIEDDYLFIASASDGLEIVDISNPEEALILGKYNDGGSIVDVAVVDQFAFTLDVSTGLEILNITNPGELTKISTYYDGDYNGGIRRCLEISQGVGYLADTSNGLIVLNLSNPLSPTKLRTVPNTGGVFAVHIFEDLMFLGCHSNGIIILDISDPLSPQRIGSFSKSGGEVYGVAGNRTHLFAADLQLGVFSLNITDPSHPTELASYSHAVPHDVFFDGKNIYLADQDMGLIILDERLQPLYSGFPRDISLLLFLQLFLIGITLVVVSILPVYWYWRNKQ